MMGKMYGERANLQFMIYKRGAIAPSLNHCRRSEVWLLAGESLPTFDVDSGTAFDQPVSLVYKDKFSSSNQPHGFFEAESRAVLRGSALPLETENGSRRLEGITVYRVLCVGNSVL